MSCASQKAQLGMEGLQLARRSRHLPFKDAVAVSGPLWCHGRISVESVSGPASLQLASAVGRGAFKMNSAISPSGTRDAEDLEAAGLSKPLSKSSTSSGGEVGESWPMSPRTPCTQ